MGKLKKFGEFVNEQRKDRIGAKVTFDDKGEEVEGKVIDRKDNGGVMVLCLCGKNKGNSKVIKRDDIKTSTALKNNVMD